MTEAMVTVAVLPTGADIPVTVRDGGELSVLITPLIAPVIEVGDTIAIPSLTPFDALRGPAGPQGPSGASGPAGPAGPAGVNSHFLHQQAQPATRWTVTHNLGRRPAVTVTDTSGQQFLVDVVHIDTSTLEINLGAAFAGQAYCV